MTKKTEPGLIIDLTKNEAVDDWLRAKRLYLRVKEGDEEAAKELKRMENTKLVKVED
jgi:hypothetical protein